MGPDGTGSDGVGPDGTGWDGVGRDGTGWDRMGLDGTGLDGMGRDQTAWVGNQCHEESPGYRESGITGVSGWRAREA